MKILIFFLFPTLTIASTIPPTPFPVFLKEGFSSVLEFEETPSRVVLGDSQSFQVERLGNSIAIKPLASYAVTNMFVYFSEDATKLFVLTASEEAEPTYYKKFESPLKQAIIEAAKSAKPKPLIRGLRITNILRDAKNDYLTADITVTADAKAPIKPNWDKVVLKYGSKAITPSKVWAERKDVLRDSTVKARFIFTKPNVPRNLKNVSLILPIAGSVTSLSSSLERFGR